MKDRCILLFIDPRDGQTFYIENCHKNVVVSYFYLLDEFECYINSEIEISDETWLYSDIDLMRYMKEIRDEGYKPILHVLIDNLSRDAAYAIEEYLIRMTGRKNIKHGNLINKYPSSKYEHRKYLHLPESEEITYKEMRAKYPEVMDVYHYWGFIHNDLYDKYCVEKERVYQEFVRLSESQS